MQRTRAVSGPEVGPGPVEKDEKSVGPCLRRDSVRRCPRMRRTRPTKLGNGEASDGAREGPSCAINVQRRSKHGPLQAHVLPFKAWRWKGRKRMVRRWKSKKQVRCSCRMHRHTLWQRVGEERMSPARGVMGLGDSRAARNWWTSKSRDGTWKGTVRGPGC